MSLLTLLMKLTSLLKKTINLFKKITLTPNFWTVVYDPSLLPPDHCFTKKESFRLHLQTGSHDSLKRCDSKEQFIHESKIATFLMNSSWARANAKIFNEQWTVVYFTWFQMDDLKCSVWFFLSFFSFGAFSLLQAIQVYYIEKWSFTICVPKKSIWVWNDIHFSNDNTFFGGCGLFL